MGEWPSSDAAPVSASPRGEAAFGWDSVFRPLSQQRTYAELDAATKDRIGHRGEAWRELVRRLGG